MSILDPNTIGVCLTPAQWKLIKCRRAQREWRERNLEYARTIVNACSKKWREKNRDVANARTRECMRRLRAKRKALYGKTYLCA
jgi:acyl-CoA reductase-like NAD-dependent aldehyde dehydrogenase